MRVDDVVIPLGVRCQQLHDPGRERAELPRQILLGEPVEGACHDVPHEDSRHHLDHRREGALGGTRENLDLNAESHQLLGHLDDVDVEPTGIPSAGPFQR